MKKAPLPLMLERLERFYGPLPQPPSDPFALYIWEVLSVHTTPPRRDAAMSALRRIPALTPDSMGRVARAKLEAAVAFAGSYREERIRALMAGVDVFRRHRDLPENLRSDKRKASEALARLPHLTAASGQWMLLLAGGHAQLPEDPRVTRVLSRLGFNIQTAEGEVGEVLSALQRAGLYLAHHGQATCVETDPLCHICPLSSDCPFATRNLPGSALEAEPDPRQ
jgi:endonuclease III